MYMKKVKQINNYIIKEKRKDEMPLGIETYRKYVVFAPDGKCIEDNLTYQEAEKFCKNDYTYIRKFN